MLAVMFLGSASQFGFVVLSTSISFTGLEDEAIVYKDMVGVIYITHL